MNGNPKQFGWPDRLGQLTSPEQVLVCTFRRWIIGMQRNYIVFWEHAWSAMADYFGSCTTRSVLRGLQYIIIGIGTSGRRPVRLHPPCCGFVCADEIWLLALIGACQRQEHGMLTALAEWLISKNGLANISDGVARIASALELKGMILPDRSQRGFCGMSCEMGETKKLKPKVTYFVGINTEKIPSQMSS